MNDRINKSRLMDRTRRARAEWDTLIAQLDDKQMLQPGFCEGWTAKDILAHITWHEREMIDMLQARALVGSDLWSLPLDERNQAIYAEHKDRSLEDVRYEAQQVFHLLMQWLDLLTEEDLHDPARFSGMPTDWEPWEVIASNTYEHYEDHIPQARDWVAKQSRAN